jgi:HSP20 family molecular chaperone IbpA
MSARSATSPTTETQREPTAERARPLTPVVDVYETEAAVVMLADVPGVAEDGVDLTVDRGILTVRAINRQQAPQGFRAVYQEYAPADFERRFTLGDAIDATGISASVANGVLRIELPKARAAVPRKIAVKAG